MRQSLFRVLTLLSVVLGLSALGAFNVVQLRAAQLATETLQPTSTFSQPTVFVPDQVNVRTGPHTNYAQVGVMVAGQTAPALGRSPGGEWIEIEYPGAPDGKGWVSAIYVTVRQGDKESLPVVEAPPTATLAPTATLPPDAVAAGTPEPTHPPTFTARPPILQPTFQTPDLGGGGFPPALLIIGLFVIGVFAGVVVILRQRA